MGRPISSPHTLIKIAKALPGDPPKIIAALAAVLNRDWAAYCDGRWTKEVKNTHFTIVILYPTHWLKPTVAWDAYTNRWRVATLYKSQDQLRANLGKFDLQQLKLNRNLEVLGNLILRWNN